MLLYASKYNDISAVVNVSGRYNLERGMKERLGEDFMERLNRDGFIDVKNKSGKPATTCHVIFMTLHCFFHNY